MNPKTTSSLSYGGARSKHGELAWLPLGAALLIISVAILAPPWSILEKAHWIGFGVCHQIAERSFQPGGVSLPLCARCSGTFMGAMLSFMAIWVMGRGRFASLPPVWILAILAAFILFWAVDGINSYLSFFPGLPHLYKPSNLLRMISGTLNGLALSFVLQPVMSLTLWQHPVRERAVAGFRELAGILVAAAVLVFITSREWAIMLYPLTVLSVFSVLALFTIINTLIVTIATRRENAFKSGSEAVPFFLWGLALSILEIGGVGLLRAWLTHMVPIISPF